VDKRKAVLGKIGRIARIKGFALTGQEQVALAEFCGTHPRKGERVIVGVANLLRKKGQSFNGTDVLAMAKYLV
jgi:hypothetical protein